MGVVVLTPDCTGLVLPCALSNPPMSYPQSLRRVGGSTTKLRLSMESRRASNGAQAPAYRWAATGHPGQVRSGARRPHFKNAGEEERARHGRRTPATSNGWSDHRLDADLLSCSRGDRRLRHAATMKGHRRGLSAVAMYQLQGGRHLRTTSCKQARQARLASDMLVLCRRGPTPATLEAFGEDNLKRR
jgi:hypothetical protein